MQAKWPIGLPVTADAIRRKTDELLARADEWTPWERRTLKAIRAAAHDVADLATGIDAIDRTDAGRRIAAAAHDLLAGYDATMVSEERVERFSERAYFTGALRHSAAMLAAIHEGIAREDVPDIGRLVAGDVDAFEHDIVSDAMVRAQGARLDGVAAARTALERLEEEDDDRELGMETEDEDDTEGEGVVQQLRVARGRRVHRRAAQARRSRNGRQRCRERIANVVAVSCEQYGVPERMRPRLRMDEDEEVDTYLWGVDAPIGDEPMPHDWKPVMKPNGAIWASVAPDAIGDLPASAVSRIVSEIQRIVLIAGRDVEIDGFGCEPSNPPTWCYACTLPLALAIRAAAGSGLAKLRLETAGALIQCSEMALDQEGVLSINSDPLLTGTRIAYYGELPESILNGIRAVEGKQVREVIAHPAFDDERIVVQRAWRMPDDSVRILIDAPVVRLKPIPPGVDGMIEDPVEAWSSYGSRLDVERFYWTMPVNTVAGEAVEDSRDPEDDAGTASQPE